MAELLRPGKAGSNTAARMYFAALSSMLTEPAAPLNRRVVAHALVRRRLIRSPRPDPLKLDTDAKLHPEIKT